MYATRDYCSILAVHIITVCIYVVSNVVAGMQFRNDDIRKVDNDDIYSWRSTAALIVACM
jgi:hypothetical protein